MCVDTIGSCSSPHNILIFPFFYRGIIRESDHNPPKHYIIERYATTRETLLFCVFRQYIVIVDTKSRFVRGHKKYTNFYSHKEKEMKLITLTIETTTSST